MFVKTRKKGYNVVMRTSVSAKRCPECGRVAALQSTECLDCGHRFRTRFEGPDDRTQAFDAVLLPRPPENFAAPVRRRQPPPPTFLFAFVGSFCLVAVLGVIIWLAWNLNQEARPTLPSSVPLRVEAQAGRADDLYDRVQLSMSLYDLDQIAGSMGRVIRTPSPYTLLLTYDFPGQTVHVLLLRSDLSGNDYRVEAVALYHGKTLVQRHTGDL